MLPEALHDGNRACAPFIPLLAPKLGESPWAIQDPARTRATGAEKSRQRLDAAIPSTGQLGLYHLRYVIAGDAGVDWNNSGGLGLLLANLARLLGPAAI